MLIKKFYLRFTDAFINDGPPWPSYDQICSMQIFLCNDVASEPQLGAHLLVKFVKSSVFNSSKIQVH